MMELPAELEAAIRAAPDDRAGYLVAADGWVCVFPSDTVARETSAANGHLVSSEEPTVYDLDAIDAWCRSSEEVLGCSESLNAWNLFGDLPRKEERW